MVPKVEMIEYCISRTSLEILKNVKKDYPLCQNEVLLIGVNYWYLPLNVILRHSLLQRYILAKIGLGRIVASRDN